MAKARVKAFDVANIGPKQAWAEYETASETCKEATRVKKAIRDHYLPLALKQGRAMVLWSGDDGLDHGFEVVLRKNFKKSSFEHRLLKKYGKKVADEIMEVYDESKDGESKTFSSF